MQQKKESRPLGHRLIIDWQKSQLSSSYLHKYGGTPSNGATLPECPGCRGNLHLMFQIDLADPALSYLKLENLGFLYVLTCLNCTSTVDPLYYRINDEGHNIRVLRYRFGACQSDYPDPLDEYPVLYRALNNDDYPETEEMLYRLLEQEGKHQLGGMPVWIQHEEHVPCVFCGSVMDYIAMVDSELYVGRDGFRERGHMFADEGILYLFSCRRCSVLATKAQSF